MNRDQRIIKELQRLKEAKQGTWGRVWMAIKVSASLILHDLWDDIKLCPIVYIWEFVRGVGMLVKAFLSFLHAVIMWLMSITVFPLVNLPVNAYKLYRMTGGESFLFERSLKYSIKTAENALLTADRILEKAGSHEEA